MNRRTAIASLPLAAAAGLSGQPDAHAAQGDSAKPLCLQYLDISTSMLERIRRTESDKLIETAYLAAQAVKNGRTCFRQWGMGHNTEFDLPPDRHGDPGIFVSDIPGDKGKEGDVFLLSELGAAIDDPRKQGVTVIGASGCWSGETPNPELLSEETRKIKYRQFCDLWIDTGLSTLDAVIGLPGEPYPLGPVSGALGLMTYWMINADAIRILAREGIPVKVRGDGPTVDQMPPREKGYEYLYSGYVNLKRPLGGDYFDEAMRQIRSIESELGALNRIAEMAVDSVLSGGKVYNYSRYVPSLCAEAIYRRGGLMLNRGLSAADDGSPKVATHQPDFTDPVFRGNAKDTVIMGFFRPDDPVDLRVLRECRKRGMKIAAIGPATRDGDIPDGDTVPKLADAHLGLMCDTYGLFAVKGVDRRVCPTSGLLVNQMFYAVELQIAEHIIRRTGNTPRIDVNASIKGMLERRERSLEIVKIRGY
jgi:uncharacterized phosphosugar-binding protein